MRMWPLALLSLLALCACNAIFGLEETVLIDAGGGFVDNDLDGIDDATDNCVEVANADQADADTDGIGDACDGCDACQPCAAPPNHDEDGDKILDGCDNCPFTANPDQANDDSDALGDVCDGSPAMETRLLFDGFGALDDDWLENGAQWTITNDSAGPSAGAPPGTYYISHASVAIPSSTAWYVEVGLVVPPPGEPRSGIFVGEARFCLLEHLSTGDWQLSASGTSSAAFAGTFDPIVRLRVTPVGPLSSQSVDCAVVGGSNVTSVLASALAYPLTFKLTTTSVGPQFAYIDVIATP